MAIRTGEDHEFESGWGQGEGVAGRRGRREGEEKEKEKEKEAGWNLVGHVGIGRRGFENEDGRSIRGCD